MPIQPMGLIVPAFEMQSAILLKKTEDLTPAAATPGELGERAERYRRQNEVLAELASSAEFYEEPILNAFYRITESVAKALEVSRVSIWRWNSDRTAIRCVDLYESKSQTHTSGAELAASAFPAYFRAWESSRVIAADDAARDPRTVEFLESYLRPQGICSMLDVPIHFRGAIEGVLCNEQVGEPRHWTDDEKAFTLAQANLVALTLERSERRHAEEHARKSFERFEIVARATTDLVYDWDVGSGSIWWGFNFRALLGYAPGQIENTLEFWVERLHPDDRARVERSLDEALKSNVNLFLEEYRFRRRDDSYAFICDRGHILRDAQARAVRVIGAMTDISGQKSIEDELRRGERRFRSLIENLSDLITVVNREGLITYEGPSSQGVLGHAPEAMMGHPYLDFIHPEDRENATKAVDQAFSETSGFSNTVLRWRHADGSWRFVESLGRKIDGQGEATVVINSRDITRSRELEDQFRQAQKMEAIGRLSGGVAHDFNNLLSVILGHVSLIDGAQIAGPEVQDSLQEITAAADRAAGLTRQLLTFSRRHRAETRLLDLNTQIACTSKMVQRVLGEDITLEVALSSEPMLVEADPGMIDQVLLNLCVNARDAMPRGGRLTIRLAPVYLDHRAADRKAQAHPGTFVCLTVADNGCGIPREILPRIFEPFFTTKEVGKGTGLGLATVYGIIGEHKGWIEVESELHHGTSFHLFIPMVRKEEALRNGELRAGLPLPGGNETILIVEDEGALRALVKRYLTRLGYSVLEAASGAEALELWRQIRGHVHLIFTDLVMPGGVNGIEFARRIQADDAKVKVLYTSGYSAEVSGAADLPAAGGGFLTKPYKPSELALALRKILDPKPPQDSLAA